MFYFEIRERRTKDDTIEYTYISKIHPRILQYVFCKYGDLQDDYDKTQGPGYSEPMMKDHCSTVTNSKHDWLYSHSDLDRILLPRNDKQKIWAPKSTLEKRP